MPSEKAAKNPAVNARAPRGPLAPVILDAAIVLVALACFWPLTRFYFAQDDFVLLEQASRGFGDAVGGFFEARPGQFRPLTKGFYFLAAWPVLGLNATAYHVLSLLLHAANALLVGVLLRRLGVTAAVSRFAAVLFACNAAFLEAVAWVSCVQQLLGTACMLAALVSGVDALERGGTRARVASSVFLALALASYEQTLAAPLVLLGWFALRHGTGAALRAARTRLWEQPLLLLLYLLFTLGVRGVPEDGPYAMSVEAHVLDNLREYTGLVYGLWVVLPAYGLPEGFTASHALLIGVVAFLALRRRFVELAFGLGTFLALLAPVLFVRDHTHTFHLYVPAIGAWFLMAAALDSARALLRGRAVPLAGPLLAVAAVVVAVVAAFSVRANVAAVVDETFRMPRSFVLRRAVLAERLRDDIVARSRLRGRPGRMVLVYPYPQFKANWRNVHAALGQGSAVRLFLASPDLDVRFVPPADPPPVEDPEVEVMIYTELGRCYTAAEVAEAQRRRAQQEGGVPGPVPADTSGVVPVE